MLPWLACAAAGFGCDEPRILGQEAAFGSSFLEDDSGKADFLLDFGTIPLGEGAVETIDVKNRGRVPLVLHHGSLQPPFGAEPMAPITLEVGGSAKLRYLFSPLLERGFERIATLSSNVDDGRIYTIRLVGEGRAALLSCDPGRLDFGPVPIGAERSLTAVCSNPLPFPIELVAPRLRGDDSFFEASVADAEEIPSGGSVEVRVAFRAQSIGAHAAMVALLDAAGREVAAIPLSAQASAAMLEIEPSSCLDFGYVALGSAATKSLRLRSLTKGSLLIDRIDLAAGAGFEVLTQTPFEVGTDLWQDVEVAFHPTVEGGHQASLILHAIDQYGQTTTQTACAQGFGGGPALRCMPDTIDFGMVAVGVPLIRRISCLNVAAEGGSDPLVIRGARSSSPFFFTRIVEEDGSDGPRRRGYLGGEGFAVEVTYAPSRERFDSGTVTVETSGGELVETRVAGQGRELAPCDFSVTPPSLNFGLVEPGKERTLAFNLRGQPGRPCLVHSLGLEAGSDPSFRMDAVEELVLEGDRTIPITFAPEAPGALFEGGASFRISDPASPDQLVPLRGAAGKSCLVLEPEIVDFGGVPPGCGSEVRWVSALNTCDEDVRIAEIGIEPSEEGAPFRVINRPTLPRTLRVRERVNVGVDFRAAGEGDSVGSLHFRVAGVGQVVAPLLGRGELAPEQTDSFVQGGPPKVDVLWVIDNSWSFEGFQEKLAANLPAFLSATVARQLDFHLAVTTSGIVRGGPECNGGGWGGEDGRFFPVDGSHPRILVPTIPNLEEHWAFNVQVGVCHTVETYLEAAYRALSPPLINEAKDRRYPGNTFQDGNAGFLRSDAALSIIFAADEKDQSTSYGRTVDDYLAFFRSLKPHGRFRAHGVTGSRSNEPSSCGKQNADRLRQVIDETGGTWLDICTPFDDAAAWAAAFERMSDGAFGFIHGFVLRSPVADANGDRKVNEDDLLLTVDGVPRSAVTEQKQRRWTFNPTTRSVEFAPLFSPRAGARIDVTYRVACAGG